MMSHLRCIQQPILIKLHELSVNIGLKFSAEPVNILNLHVDF